MARPETAASTIPSRLASSDEETTELRAAVRAGRFLEVQEWIASGRPIYFPESRKHHALEIAVKYGFHSMVELLATVWPDLSTLNHALHLAVNKKRADLVFLLMKYGVDLKFSPLSSVAMVCDKKLMQFVLDNWEEYGGNRGLGLIVTAMPRPLTGLIRQYADKIPDYERQLTESLLYFIDDFSPLWIGLALWMGANPLHPVRTPGIGPDEPDERMTPIEYAVLKGNKEALEQLKPKKQWLDYTQLLKHTLVWRRGGLSMAEHLVELGADINDKPNGGSSVLDRLLEPSWEFSHSGFDPLFSWGEVSRVERWIGRGARFVPNNGSGHSEARRGINIADADHVERTLKALRRAASFDDLFKLFNTPKLRKKLELTPSQLRTRLKPLPPKLPKGKPGATKAETNPIEYLGTDIRSFRQRKPHIVPEKSTHYLRAELYEAIWTTPAMRLASQLGLSDVGLAKICKRFKIPRPGRGYWAKHDVGMKLPRKKLKQSEWNPKIVISTQLRTPEITNESRRQKVHEQIKEIIDAHPTIDFMSDDAPLHPGLTYSLASGDAPTREDPRLLRVSNTLFRFLAGLGWSVRAETESGWGNYAVETKDKQIRFIIRREAAALTVSIPDAVYGTRSKWRDGRQLFIESQFVDIASWMLYIAALQ